MKNKNLIFNGLRLANEVVAKNFTADQLADYLGFCVHVHPIEKEKRICKSCGKRIPTNDDSVVFWEIVDELISLQKHIQIKVIGWRHRFTCLRLYAIFQKILRKQK